MAPRLRLQLLALIDRELDRYCNRKCAAAPPVTGDRVSSRFRAPGGSSARTMRVDHARDGCRVRSWEPGDAPISHQQADDPLEHEQPADHDKAPDGELPAPRPGPIDRARGLVRRDSQGDQGDFNQDQHHQVKPTTITTVPTVEWSSCEACAAPRDIGRRKASVRLRSRTWSWRYPVEAPAATSAASCPRCPSLVARSRLPLPSPHQGQVPRFRFRSRRARSRRRIAGLESRRDDPWFVFAEVWPGVAKWVRMTAASLRLALGSGLPSSCRWRTLARRERAAAALVVRVLACQTLVSCGSET
jgi:hypothetical protein